MAERLSYRTNLSTLGIVLHLCRMIIDPKTGVRNAVGIAAAIEGVGTLSAIAGPFMMKLLIDSLTEAAATGQSVGLAVAFIMSWVGMSFLSTLRLAYSTQVLNRLGERLTVDAIRSRLPAAACQRAGDSGNTLGALERLPFSLMVVVDGLIWQLVPIAFQIAGSLWLISSLLPDRYALILLIILIAYGLSSLVGATTHRRTSIEANLAASDLSSLTGDILRNARRVVFNGALDFELANLTSSFQSKSRANVRVIWSLVRLAAWQYGVLGIGLMVLLILGANDTLNHQMTVGTFVLLQAYGFRLALPLSSLGFIVSQSLVAMANIREVMMLGEPSVEVGDLPLMANGPAAIILDAVGFSYDGISRTLEDVSVTIEPGSFVLIAGANGSGKSTLAQIIAGILETNRGRVMISGQDLRGVSPRERHHLILYVAQFIGMLNRTLGANGLYPPTTHTEEDLAKLLTWWRFYEGDRRVDLEVMAGEQGERLSGGQLQKLELARIAGVHVPALILDESTSALDPSSEVRIMNDLRARLGERTTLVMISHRIQMAQLADRVLFMKDGRMAGDGKHEDLMSAIPEYAGLWAKRNGRLRSNKKYKNGSGNS